MTAYEATNPVAALWAIEQIRRLKATYFHAVDAKDYAAIASLFTDDAVVDFSGEPAHHVGHHGVEPDAAGAARPVIGGRATAQVIKEAIDGIVSVHHGFDPIITVDSATTASGTWSMYDQLNYSDETMHGYGHYRETYVLGDHGWRFSSLKLSRLRVVWASA
jgi:SnoaL-like domain